MRFMLTPELTNKWVHNILIFLAPLGVIYFGAITVVISAANHVVNIADFIPTQFTMGAMMLYTVNALYDYCRKLVSK